MSDSELGTRPAMGCSPGTVLGSRYTLRRRIGSGGYSEVWAGHDAVLDRPVAVKLLHAEHTGHAETLHRFRSEAQLSAQLSDANIARVYDFNDAGGEGTPYLVMEFVDGPTLAQILRAGPLPAARAMDILAQAAAGLQAAHSAGLVHRDIKPSNIMVAPGNVVKITDFGLSHTLASAPITRTDMVAGTPGYLAPERSAGVRATAASDLYGLGVVGYECVAGAPPFEGTPIEVMLAHRDCQFPPVPPGTPAPVADLIAELTAKDPASAGQRRRRGQGGGRAAGRAPGQWRSPGGREPGADQAGRAGPAHAYRARTVRGAGLLVVATRDRPDSPRPDRGRRLGARRDARGRRRDRHRDRRPRAQAGDPGRGEPAVVPPAVGQTAGSPCG